MGWKKAEAGDEMTVCQIMSDLITHFCSDHPTPAQTFKPGCHQTCVAKTDLEVLILLSPSSALGLLMCTTMPHLFGAGNQSKQLGHILSSYSDQSAQHPLSTRKCLYCCVDGWMECALMLDSLTVVGCFCFCFCNFFCRRR